MATKTKRLSELSGEELGALIDLMKGSDSIELKVTLPASEHRATIDALALDPLDAQIRQVFFFDTPDLQLTRPAWRCAPAVSGAERRFGSETAPGCAGRAARGHPPLG